MSQFDELFDCFVISLARTPERLTAFRENNAKCDINVQHFVAVDGTTISEADVRRILAPGARYNRGSIGNALSHRTLWERCSRQAKNFIVFEDDAVLRHDIKTSLPALLIENWDIIVLGYNSDTPLELNIAPGISCGVRFCFGSRLSPARKPVPQQLFDFSGSTSSPVALHRLYLSLGTCGYVVSPKGAQVLTKSCFPLDNRPVHYDSVQHSFRAAALDAVMATVYRRIAAYACFTPLVMTALEASKSTVNANRPGLGEDFLALLKRG